ncbi:MAG: hypothetical protein H7839_15310 [Magnetococcus sp. YQC-5]
MIQKLIMSMLLVGFVTAAASLVHAAEAIPSEEELTTQCKQFAVEDQVTPKEMDAYVTQCVLDLKEQYLPAGNDYPEPPTDAPKDTPKEPAR